MAVLKVVGVTFGRRQEVLRVLYDEFWTENREDEVRLELVSEVGNPYDENATRIQVEALSGHPEFSGARLGYVPAELAAKVRAAIVADRVGRVVLESMSYAGGSRIVSASVRLLRRIES